MTVSWWRWFAPAALACALASCSGGRPRNVLLVSIDTLRADHLGCYGFQNDTTPHIDALARAGVRFENVLSPVPLTLPAHASLLTGTIPPIHGIHDNLSSRLEEASTTLAELFRKQGFRTGAIVSSFVLDSRFNLSQGFDTYNDEFEEEHKIAFLSERKGDETTRLARAWLEEHRGGKFFLFLHYYDPHDDYAPPPPFDARFFSDPYSGEVAFVDQQVGEVVSKLEELDLFDDTLIVVVGDHGEMLEEHGEATHGYFIYESALRVPWILRGPGIQPGVVAERVGLIDVAPTIAALLGLELPTPTQGRDLSASIGGGDVEGRRELYVESVTPNRYYGLNSLFGLVTDRWKYIHTERAELYDLADDPEEATNLVDDNPRIASGMKSRLDEILEAKAPSGSEPNLDEDALKRLGALGYLSGRAGRAVADGLVVEPERGDPKDWIAFYRNHQRLEKLVAAESYREARELAENLIRDKPDFVAGHLQLGLIATETAALVRARFHFSKALELDPENRAGHLGLAEVLTRLGEPAAAIEHYRKVLALDPDSGDAKRRLAQLLADEGDVQSAIAYLREANAADPESADARAQMGLVLASNGAWDEAASELRSALAIDPDHAEAHFHLGTVLARQGRLDEAIAHYRRALETAPKPAEVYHRLGLALRSQGKMEEALEHLTKAVELDPKLAMAHNNLGLTLKEMGRLDEALAHYEKALQIDPDLAEAHNNLGSLLASRGAVQEAIQHFRRALQADPEYGEAHNNLGLALRMTGDRDEALLHFRAALKKRPDWTEPMNELAWILATHPDATQRKPEEALRLANRAAELTAHRQPVTLDTLAAAYAANEDFDRAITMAQEAVSLASSRAPELAKEIQSRLDLYRQGKPFREASRTRAAPPP